MSSKFTISKILVGTARFFSAAMSPLLMPAYGVFLVMWTSILCALPAGTRFTVLVMVLGITAVLPVIVIGILHHYGMIGDKRLISRRERLVPYLFTIMCYMAATGYLYYIHSPQWFVMFMAGGALSCALSCVITLWWKISAHMAGIGGVVALIYQIHVQGLSAFDFFWLLSATMVLAGVLGSSRLILKRHDLGQVIAGFLNGYVCVTLMMKIFG